MKRTRVFAHGSLMFRPASVVISTAPARAWGWERRLGHPSIRNWGTPQAPAPTSCLVRGGETDGLCLEIPSDRLEAIRRREAGAPLMISVELGARTVPVWTWPMSSAWAERPLASLVAAARRNIARGGGPFGDARDYAVGIRDTLAAHGLTDRRIDRYLELLDEGDGQLPGGQ